MTDVNKETADANKEKTIITPDELQIKKNALLNFGKKGIPFDRACLLVNVSPEIADLLYNDEDFQHCYNQKQAVLEHDLVERVVAVAKRAEETGNTVEARWLLERINPEHWGKAKVDVSVAGISIPEEYAGI